MGKFLNTTKSNTVNTLVEGLKKRLDHPFYIFNDKHPTIVTFYNVNDTKSTLDEGSKQVYAMAGDNAPLRYNKIKNVMMYGLERIQTELDVGDYGLEASDIEGECYLPPNNFTPYPDSYFTINHVSRGTYWFRINKISSDTLENGQNFWKLQYTLETVGEDALDIDKRVEKNFIVLSDNIGSNYKSVVLDEEYKFVERLESVLNTLCEYYHSLYFKEELQTYVFKYSTGHFYNPEVIEFIRANKVLSYKDKYTYIDQAVALPDTFSLQYNRSLYHAVESKDKKFKHRRYYGISNDDPRSLLAMRMEDYYIVTPEHLGLIADPLNIYPMDMLRAISGDEHFEGSKAFYNIIKYYFNGGGKLSDEIIDSLEDIDYTDSMEMYHLLPVIIYILAYDIKDIMKLKPAAKALM